MQFPDGAEAEYSANIITQNIYAQCDLDGNQHLLLECIVDHKKDGTTVPEAESYTTYKGRKRLNKTTKGWHLYGKWRDSTSSWESLASLKESNPVEVAEYVAQGIDSVLAFVWWVPFTLKKRDRLISTVNTRYHKQTYKYGILVPKSVTEAKVIGTANGNIL